MSNEYHEPAGELPQDVREVHRALASVIEELEAVDWYHQRAANTEDAELKSIIEHNRDEEVEHAAMALEWLRRRLPIFDEQLRTYLFTSDPILEVEEKAEAAEEGSEQSGSLNIGSLRKEKE